MGVLDRILRKHAGCAGGDCANGIAKAKPDPAPPAQLKPLLPPGAAQPGVAAASLPKIAGWVPRDRNAEWRYRKWDPKDPDSSYWWDDTPSKEQRDYEKARKAYADQKHEERWGETLRAVDPNVTKGLTYRGHLGMGLGAAGVLGGLGTLVHMTRSANPRVRGAAMIASTIPAAAGLASVGVGLRGYRDAYKYQHADPEIRAAFNKDYLKARGTDVDAVALGQRAADFDRYDKTHGKRFNQIYEWSDEDE